MSSYLWKVTEQPVVRKYLKGWGVKQEVEPAGLWTIPQLLFWTGNSGFIFLCIEVLLKIYLGQRYSVGSKKKILSAPEWALLTPLTLGSKWVGSPPPPIIITWHINHSSQSHKKNLNA